MTTVTKDIHVAVKSHKIKDKEKVREPEWIPHKLADEDEIVESNDSYKIKLEISNFRKQEIEVSVEDSHLIIKGEHGEQCDKNNCAMHQFIRKYSLREVINAERVKSDIKHGILTVVVTKRPK